jgi:hypothetical protein
MVDPDGYKEATEDYGPLTRQQAENVADLAARRAEERLYAAVGRSIVKKILYLLGAAGVALISYWQGLIHFGKGNP